MTDADALVARYILDVWRAEHPEHAGCATLRVTNPDASDGAYGCDTGCSYYRFTAEAGCEHQAPEEFEFGDFGELADILEDLQRDYADGTTP
ncbi:hypothetical protein Caci_2936 [Catenulispora acidiphila DSM 44928]|uniref:Uncharacterized protein n=1 Tax=Catenulispora acidiphila (strain DSM 44928 / JCM 14897 / NBRC 102108 / NRRL B-24433 / ID139908) TaxID=479433 RepID=C7Q2V3_CATAD|nr:hypothetical protein [Catenulispora acidiphila]ACU71845.1 hypothetical protein Caci_2936 [Catenulispora acidiphila DSM 44928]